MNKHSQVLLFASPFSTRAQQNVSSIFERMPVMETGDVSIEINGQSVRADYFASRTRLVVSSPFGAKTVYRGSLPAQTLATAVLKHLASSQQAGGFAQSMH